MNLYGYCGAGPVLGWDPHGTNFISDIWGSASDTWVNFSEWYSGTDTFDANGNRVRIGGWPALLNADSNGLTINGTIHLNDYDDFERYINDQTWQDHEERHLQQQEEYCSGSGFIFGTSTVGQYLFTLGHDNAPFEREAENYARVPYVNPLGAPWLGDPLADGENPDRFGLDAWPIKPAPLWSRR